MTYFNCTELHARYFFLIENLNSLGCDETGHILSQILFFSTTGVNADLESAVLCGCQNIALLGSSLSCIGQSENVTFLVLSTNFGLFLFISRLSVFGMELFYSHDSRIFETSMLTIFQCFITNRTENSFRLTNNGHFSSQFL